MSTSLLVTKMEEAAKAKGIPASVIDTVNYGMMNDEVVFERATNHVNNK